MISTWSNNNRFPAGHSVQSHSDTYPCAYCKAVYWLYCFFWKRERYIPKNWPQRRRKASTTTTDALGKLRALNLADWFLSSAQFNRRERRGQWRRITSCIDHRRFGWTMCKNMTLIVDALHASWCKAAADEGKRASAIIRGDESRV